MKEGPMWTKMMHRWLLGMAVTVAAPANATVRAALPACDDEPARAGDDRPSRGWGVAEPRLSEVLADPIVRALMIRDGVAPAQILDLARRVEPAEAQDSRPA